MTAHDREVHTDPEFRVAALAVIASRAHETYKSARDDLARRLRRGYYSKAWRPGGGDSEADELGSVSMSKPDYSARVTDEAALVEWLLAHDYHGLTATEHVVAGPQAEVVDVLLAHAPHLVERVTRVEGFALSDILRASAQAHEPVGPGAEAGVPGIVVERPQSQITVRPNDNARKVVAELLDSGRLGYDGYLRGAP